jgi:hypothetical protein
MSPCRWILLLAGMIMFHGTLILPVEAFTLLIPRTVMKKSTTSISVTEKVEVCQFKDCKRAGGGPRLVKQIGDILNEKGLSDSISVTLCDCQVCLNFLWLLSFDMLCSFYRKTK